MMCATAFYLIENYPLDVGTEFSASIVQVSHPARLSPETGVGICALSPVGWHHWVVPQASNGPDSEALPLAQMCGVMLSGSEESTPSIIYHCVLRGLERLLLSEQLSRLDAESLVKLSVDRVNVHSPHRSMAALGLMLTCMYTGESSGARGSGPPVPDGLMPPSSRPYGSVHLRGALSLGTQTTGPLWFSRETVEQEQGN